MSYDLILVCASEAATPELFSSLRERVEGAAALESCDVVDMMDVVAGGHDALDQAIEQKEATAEAFEEYCSAEDIDPNDDESAGMFLATLFGQNLLFVSLPDESTAARVVFAELRAIASELKLRLHDPQEAADIEETFQEPLPARFGQAAEAEAEAGEPE